MAWLQAKRVQMFVPFTLEGERVEVSGTSTRRQLVKVIEPSPNRIDPVCKHFGTCGGCQLATLRACSIFNMEKRAG